MKDSSVIRCVAADMSDAYKSTVLNKRARGTSPLSRGMAQDFHFSELEVFVSPKCNYACRHCGIKMAGFPDVEITLARDDIDNIETCFQKFAPGELRFTGGEPTLRLDLVNAVIERVLKARPDVTVAITTNGWFCSSRERCESVLRRVAKIDSLQISYDRYHAEFTPRTHLQMIKEYCDRNAIDLNIACCIASPTDLLEMLEVEKASGIRTAFQNALPVNSALSCEHYRYQYFDEQVLDKRCRNIDGLFYFPSYGFTQCCSSLLFQGDRDVMQKICKPKAEDYISSSFSRMLTGSTFSEIADAVGAKAHDFLPAHSEPCEICKYLFTKLYKESSR